MAKRTTGVGRHGKFHSPKTKKRLEIKRLMLIAKKTTRPRHCRPINPERLKAKS